METYKDSEKRTLVMIPVIFWVKCNETCNSTNVSRAPSLLAQKNFFFLSRDEANAQKSYTQTAYHFFITSS